MNLFGLVLVTKSEGEIADTRPKPVQPWDPYLKTDVGRLERIQHQAARFITRDHKTREPGCITKMLNRFRITNTREKKNSPTSNIYVQMVEGLVPAILPSDFITKTRPKRLIKWLFFFSLVLVILNLFSILVMQPGSLVL
jgi:hypothetical protein